MDITKAYHKIKTLQKVSKNASAGQLKISPQNKGAENKKRIRTLFVKITKKEKDEDSSHLQIRAARVLSSARRPRRGGAGGEPPRPNSSAGENFLKLPFCKGKISQSTLPSHRLPGQTWPSQYPALSRCQPKLFGQNLKNLKNICPLCRWPFLRKQNNPDPKRWNPTERHRNSRSRSALDE